MNVLTTAVAGAVLAAIIHAYLACVSRRMESGDFHFGRPEDS